MESEEHDESQEKHRTSTMFSAAATFCKKSFSPTTNYNFMSNSKACFVQVSSFNVVYGSILVRGCCC